MLFIRLAMGWGPSTLLRMTLEIPCGNLKRQNPEFSFTRFVFASIGREDAVDCGLADFYFSIWRFSAELSKRRSIAC